jgi:hypothetical protein
MENIEHRTSNAERRTDGARNHLVFGFRCAMRSVETFFPFRFELFRADCQSAKQQVANLRYKPTRFQIIAGFDLFHRTGSMFGVSPSLLA